MQFIKFRIFLCLCLWSFLHQLNAQSGAVQVVTKRIDKTFSYRDGYEVNVDGVRAEVSIVTWSKPEIKVQIDFIVS